jgi:hypothetical protein
LAKSPYGDMPFITTKTNVLPAALLSAVPDMIAVVK